VNVEFIVKGKPRGKERARTFYNSKSKKMQTITPTKTVSYEDLIKSCFYNSKPKNFKLIEGPILVELAIVYKKAKSNKMTTPMLKPDIDNVLKIVLDALNKVAYKDDTQVVSAVANKIFGEEEMLKIIIREL